MLRVCVCAYARVCHFCRVQNELGTRNQRTRSVGPLLLRLLFRPHILFLASPNQVLVNNAGIQPPGACVPLHELGEVGWDGS